MTLLYPGATWRPLGAQSQPAMTGHDLVIVHTMVGSLVGTDTMFRAAGYTGTESHYGLGGSWGRDRAAQLDGVVYQWQDRSRTADANLDANPIAISVETADNAPANAEDIARWTTSQAASLVELLAWECSVAAHAQCPPEWTCHTRGIPAALVPDSRPGRRGIAYHRQGIDPWRVPGGQEWSTARGKACPGPQRIAQLTEEIIPAVGVRLEESMAITDAEWRHLIREVRVLTNENGADPEAIVWTLATGLQKTDSKLDGIGSRIDAITAHLDLIADRTLATRTDLGAVLDRLAALQAQLTTVQARLETLEAGGVDLDALAVRVSSAIAPAISQAVEQAIAQVAGRVAGALTSTG